MRGGQGVMGIDRPRVLTAMVRSPLTLLEAPGGYGKSSACTQLAGSLDLAAVKVVPRVLVDVAGLLSTMAAGCRRAGLLALATAVDPDDPTLTADRFLDRVVARPDPILLIVDEVQRLSPQAASWLAELAATFPDRSRLVIAGRRLGSALTELAAEQGATLLSGDDLRFDRAEITALLASVWPDPPDAEEVGAVQRATQGWPAAVVLVALQSVDGGRDRLSVPGGTRGVLRELVDQILLHADPQTRALLDALAELPLLSASVLAVIGGDGALDRVLDAGLPIRFRADGWGELADPVQELLTGAALTPPQARAVAGVYADHGELAEAVALLHRRSDHDGVVELLAIQPSAALVQAGSRFLEVVLAATPDTALVAAADLLVRLAQETEHQPRLRTTFLQRATRLVRPQTPTHRALQIEHAMDAARADDIDGPILVAEEVLADAAPQELLTRGRAHLVRALCVLHHDTAGSTRAVAAELDQAAALFRMAGAHRWESFAHLAAGYGCDFADGAFESATARLERALALRSSADIPRAEALVCVAEVRTHIGRLDDADGAIAEASTIGHRLGDDRIIAFAAWSAAELACQRRDGAAAEAALTEAEAHPGGWFDRFSGIDFLAHASEIRTRLGDIDGAHTSLDRATARAAGTAREDVPLATAARLEATFGDPAAASSLLEALDASTLALRRDRWLRLLLRAVCAVRTGDTATAAQLVRQARRDAAEQGDPGRPDRREPELMALLVPAQPPSAVPAMRVVVLGRFAVERDGADVSPPPGRPALLVKLLALRSVLTSDEAIDLLWPDADLDTGRARLRNVLSRIRSRCGDLVVRSGGSLSLAADVDVDARRVEAETAAALAADAPERAGLARGALALVTGELLPTDSFEEWAAAPRERLLRRHLALLDLVADEAVRQGDLDEACRLLDTALTTDPLEEIRYVRLARVLLTQGRRASARRVVERGLGVAEELDVPADEELATLAADLHRGR